MGDRSRSSSKRHRASKSDISNENRISKSEKKLKKNNGTTLPELPNIIKVVKNRQDQSLNSSPVAEIQAEEELHTDNESDAETRQHESPNVVQSETGNTSDIIKVQKVTFGT